MMMTEEQHTFNTTHSAIRRQWHCTENVDASNKWHIRNRRECFETNNNIGYKLHTSTHRQQNILTDNLKQSQAKIKSNYILFSLILDCVWIASFYCSCVSIGAGLSIRGIGTKCSRGPNDEKKRTSFGASYLMNLFIVFSIGPNDQFRRFVDSVTLCVCLTNFENLCISVSKSTTTTEKEQTNISDAVIDFVYSDCLPSKRQSIANVHVVRKKKILLNENICWRSDCPKKNQFKF